MGGQLSRRNRRCASPTEEGLTSRVMTTTTSRLVSMIFFNYNTNPVIDVRRRW